MKIDCMQIISEIRDTRQKVSTGEITVRQGTAEARLYAQQSKMILASIEHAKIAGRIGMNSDVLPSFIMSDESHNETQK